MHLISMILQKAYKCFHNENASTAEIRPQYLDFLPESQLIQTSFYDMSYLM
jgi:hypothetical protein